MGIAILLLTLGGGITFAGYKIIDNRKNMNFKIEPMVVSFNLKIGKQQ